jgi:glucose/arabinose dehydrogenase
VNRSVLILIGVGLLTAGCASNGESGGGGASDGHGSAVIVTTTTTTTPTTTSTTTSGETTASTDEATGATAAPSPTSAPPDSSSPPVTNSTEPAPTTTVPPAVGNPVVASEVVGRFDTPVDLAVRPGDDALWIVEQPGRVVRFDGTEPVTQLDVSGRVSTGNEQGLLGLEFSADGALAYVDFTDRSNDTVIAEFAVGAGGAFDPASERILLTIDQPYRNHNAGDLARGPDGMLFITLGDGGSGGDPQRNASNPATLLGSLLRIDPTPTLDAPYTIPADNPFADGGAGAPEVWAWGLRNPWKIAFDPVTDELWIADVGQNEYEEVNVVGAVDGFTAGRGVDFGWSAFEGTARFNTDVPDSGTTTPPVLTYSHRDGCSISGGVPYRGTAITGLEPAYVYSDFCTSTIWALDLAGARTLTLLEGFEGVTAVRAGPDGELYVLERAGAVHRLVPG